MVYDLTKKFYSIRYEDAVTFICHNKSCKNVLSVISTKIFNKFTISNECAKSSKLEHLQMKRQKIYKNLAWEPIFAGSLNRDYYFIYVNIDLLTRL